MLDVIERQNAERARFVSQLRAFSEVFPTSIPQTISFLAMVPDKMSADYAEGVFVSRGEGKTLSEPFFPGRYPPS